jgi:DNA (cytosine-5)-methyltransferase 1
MTGVDIEGHPDYLYEMIEADALAVLADVDFLDTFDFVHASPPCMRWSLATGKNRDKHPDFITPTREFLRAWGGPYVIENVPGAPLENPIRLCGSSFALRVRRHRLFESNMPLDAPGCRHTAQGRPVGVYGQHADRRQHLRPDGTQRGTKAVSIADAKDAMGIDWMTNWSDLADAIPPAYTEHLGIQVGQILEARRVTA